MPVILPPVDPISIGIDVVMAAIPFIMNAINKGNLIQTIGKGG